MTGVTRQLTPSQARELALYADGKTSGRIPSRNLVRRDLVRALGYGQGYRITPFGIDMLMKEAQ
jgi:hypothetical protein